MSAYAPASALTFDAAAHTYSLNGERIHGVTQVLKDAGIIDLSGIPEPTLAWAAARGTAVHLALQYLDEGTLDRQSLDPVIGPYIEAYERFCRDADFGVDLIEARVCDPVRRYAGTLDRTGTMAGDQRICLDIKTGPILPGYALQLAAYTACLPEPRRHRRMALRLRDDGTYQMTDFQQRDFQRDLDIFLAALAVRQWIDAKRR